MDACAGNVTDVCKIGQELLMSVRNLSEGADDAGIPRSGQGGNCAELSDHGTIPADESLFNVVLPYIYMYINQYCQIYRTHI